MVDKICDNCMNRVPPDAEQCPKCGIRFENTNPGGALPNGWVLGERYTIGRYLDIDGEGVIYSAIDGNTLQRVTVKEFMPVTLCASRDEDGAIQPKPGCEVLFKTTRMDYSDLYATLLRQGLVEGLVQVLDVVEENNTSYAVLERVEGPTLAEYLTKNPGAMEPARAMAMLRPVLLGVETLHAANVIHRGICPENIILESGGTAKLCGFATLALRQQGSELKPKLYPGYSAPEQYAASEFEGRYTDVYALGALLYRMFTGFAPPAADERKMQDALRPARALNKNIQQFLSAALVRAMRIAPAERIQSVPDLRLALSGEGGKGAGGPLGLTRQQMIVGSIALGVVIILIIVIILIATLGGGKTPDSSSDPLASSSSEAPEGELRVPDFEGRVFEDVVKNREYTDVFIFGEHKQEFDEDVPEGRIISQTPAAGTVWDGETPIVLVVSRGPETVEMPDFVNNATTREEALKALEDLGVDLKRVAVYGRANDGSKTPGVVLETDPAPGAPLQLNSDRSIVIYVASEISSARMPNLTGLAEAAAIAELNELGIQYNPIVYQDNDGTYLPGTVVSTDKAVGSTIMLASDRVTITVAKDVSMPNLVGKTIEEAQAIIDQLKNTPSRVSISLYFVDEESSTVPAGQIIRTDRDGGTVKNGEQVRVYVARAPAGSVPDPGASAP